MQRQFSLPEQDTQDLDGYGLEWDTIRESSNQWLILRNFRLPDGFTQERVDVAINIVPGYPVAQLDMVYFNPGISRVDGASIPAIAIQQFLGKTWQRWSRHRTGQNPWRPDLDNIRSHISLIEWWLEKESQKNAVLV